MSNEETRNVQPRTDVEKIRAEILRRASVADADAFHWHQRGLEFNEVAAWRARNTALARRNELMSVVEWMDQQEADPYPYVPATIRSGGQMQTMKDPYGKDFK